MAETPFEQDDVAVATKLTEEPTVAPLLGLLTFTPAIAGMANAHRHTNAVSFPSLIPISPADFFC
jgi:hypothetical protein